MWSAANVVDRQVVAHTLGGLFAVRCEPSDIL